MSRQTRDLIYVAVLVILIVSLTTVAVLGFWIAFVLVGVGGIAVISIVMADHAHRPART